LILAHPLGAQTWIKDNTGYALVIVAALGLVLGFLLGRLSARPQVRYVIPSELAPLVLQLFVLLFLARKGTDSWRLGVLSGISSWLGKKRRTRREKIRRKKFW